MSRMSKSKQQKKIDETIERCAIGRVAIMILESNKSPDGQFIPLIVHEGETGYYQTDWKWGDNKPIAEQMAREYNQKLGLTDREVVELIGQSFRLRRN